METTTSSTNTTDSASLVELASWNRPRTSEELRGFIESHHDSRLDGIELE